MCEVLGYGHGFLLAARNATDKMLGFTERHVDTYCDRKQKIILGHIAWQNAASMIALDDARDDSAPVSAGVSCKEPQPSHQHAAESQQHERPDLNGVPVVLISG